jgi:hypothetical protein
MNVSIFKLITGDEIVCEVTSLNKKSVTIRNACIYSYIPVDDTYMLSISPFLKTTIFNQEVKISKKSILMEIDPCVPIREYYINTLEEIKGLTNSVLEVFSRNLDSDSDSSDINNYIEDNNTYH